MNRISLLRGWPLLRARFRNHSAPATTAQVRERITGMQPQVQTLAQGYQETAVDLRLEGVQLPELLALLAVIDQAPYDLHVRHLQIRPKFDNPVNLDATVRVLSYAKS